MRAPTLIYSPLHTFHCVNQSWFISHSISCARVYILPIGADRCRCHWQGSATLPFCVRILQMVQWPSVLLYGFIYSESEGPNQNLMRKCCILWLSTIQFKMYICRYIKCQTITRATVKILSGNWNCEFAPRSLIAHYHHRKSTSWSRQ